MELVRTISDRLALTRLEVVDKCEMGGGLEGFLICKVVDADDVEGEWGWKGRELAVFDEHFYTNTEFLRPGFRVKGALKLLGGYTGERVAEGTRSFDRRMNDRAWEGYVMEGRIAAEAHLGHIVDVGIPVHCHFAFSSNIPLIERWKAGGAAPAEEELDMPSVGEWVRVIGGLYVYLLKELILVCSSCGRREKYLTTTLPTMDEISGLSSVCRRCKHEQPSNAFPDICDNCQKRMWQWKGAGVEFPLDCECGNSRYDFFYDHKPVFIE